MRDWLNSIGNNFYPLILLAIISIPILVVAIILKVLLGRLGDEKQIQLSFAKSIFWGIAIPTFGMWMWFGYYNNPFNEYKLITNPTTANGFIKKVKYNDALYFYQYEFTFSLPNGRTIQGWGQEDVIPKYWTDIENTPYHVIVEYLSDNPKVNRVKGIGNETLYEWFRYPILMGIIVLLLGSYFGFTIVKNGLEEYRTELQNLKRQSEKLKSDDSLAYYRRGNSKANLQDYIGAS